MDHAVKNSNGHETTDMEQVPSRSPSQNCCRRGGHRRRRQCRHCPNSFRAKAWIMGQSPKSKSRTDAFVIVVVVIVVVVNAVIVAMASG